ncbi:hypothetical protein RFI_24769 [Reticulomyxa filosa]|uniref:RING-type domain-containing protein n=1 Tax=Reticulomyxa filosa TaxID=46433 RepID=X6MFD3_RETFI|nr:hypothetical protein RFI_24769 [Reticulomyxa filosa]|eukprot:ETO12604.1 hypothetical protein RFI_24769 [Reticulomyxa filosa]
MFANECQQKKTNACKIKVNAKTLSAEQRTSFPNRWMNSQCWLSKKDMPVCGLYSPDGHKWFADRKMLNQYVKKCLNKNQLDQITTRFTVSDLKDILPQEIFQDYAERSLKELLEKPGTFCKCPACSSPFELDVSITGTLVPEEQTTLAKLTDDDGNSISESAQKHYMEFRIRCRNNQCGKDFCRSCWEQPYHIGFDCEQFRSKQDAPKCRFCSKQLNESNRVSNPPSKALASVCTDELCLTKMKVSCTKVLPCGHV